MTNETSNIPPALRPRTTLVRGGRLTKFKGQVASIAPGLLVVATAAVLLTGGVDQAMACGAVAGNTVVCGADADTSTPEVDPYANGIDYTGSNARALTLNGPGFTVGGSGVALDVTHNNHTSVYVGGGGSITTNGTFNHGVFARTEGTGNVNAHLDGGTIVTTGVVAHGVNARIGNDLSTATVTSRMTDGHLIIKGAGSGGVASHTTGLGNVNAELLGGRITMENDATGIGAEITNRNSEATATARMVDGYVTSNVSAVMVRHRGDKGLGIARMDGGTVKVRGSHAVSVVIDNGDIDAEATAMALMTGGSVETIVSNSSGLRAAVDGGGGRSIAEIWDGAITTHASQAHGLQAFANNTENLSDATATVRMIGGSISIGVGSADDGHASHGMYAQANGGLSNALAEMHGGAITTIHGAASAIYVRIDSTENAGQIKAYMTGGEINTFGNRSHGIVADTTGRGDVVVEMRDGTVSTVGRNSHGIWAEAEARAGANFVREVEGSQPQAKTIVNLGEDAVVTASGAGSNGIRVSGNYVTVDSDPNSPKFWLGVKEFDVDVAGTVTGGADGFGADDDGAAIRTISDADGDADGDRTIDITDTAIVIAGASGIAIHTLTASSSGDATADGDGSTVINSAGIIEGDILLDAGDDILIVTGGSIIGDVHGGEGDITLTLEDGLLAGDVRLGAGDDRVTIGAAASYDFSHTLDGGAGDNDHLTLHGRRTMTSMENITGWEHLTLKDKMEMRLDGMDRLDMGLSIDATSTFRASGGGRSTGATIAGKVANVPGGGLTITGDVTNAGDLTLSVQDGAAGDVITIDGDYTNTGSGSSVFALDARMDGTDTDTLHFMGDVTGETMLSIASLGGGGAGGAPLEVDVVTVDGASDGATFTLMEGNHVMSDGEHAMIAGAYLYRLAETDSGWALSALSEDDEITWQPASPLYDSYGAALLGFNTPASLRNRGSSQDFRSLAWDGGAGADTAGQDAGSPLWIQMGTDQITSSEENSTTGSALESSVWEMEIGADIVLNDSAAGLLVGGLMLSYATGSTDVTSDFGDGSIDTTGLGLGLSATWYDTRGFYVDGQLTWTSYASDLSSDSFGTLTEGNSGTGYALSIEAGQRLDLGSRLTVIPQAQLSLSSVGFSDFTSERREGPQGEAQQEQVALSEATSQRLRLGLEVGEQDPGASGLYGMVNLFHEFGAGSEVEVDGASLTTEHEPWAVGVGLGGTYAWNDRVDLFGEASYATGLSNAGETSTLSASAGLKITF